MIRTNSGLPNACFVTGEPITDGYWYAESEDAARAGLGICETEYKRRLADTHVNVKASPAPPDDGEAETDDTPAPATTRRKPPSAKRKA